MNALVALTACFGLAASSAFTIVVCCRGDDAKRLTPEDYKRGEKVVKRGDAFEKHEAATD
jgi:hypothetical protein